MDRLQLVLYRAAPSQSIPWNQENGQDAQDTIHSEQRPNDMDISGPSLRLPTPNLEISTSGEQTIQEELVSDKHRSSDNPGTAQKQSSPTHGEEDSRFPLPSANSAMQSSPDQSRETVAGTSPLDAPSQLNLDPSMKLTTLNDPSQNDQGYIGSSTQPLNSLNNNLKSSSPLEANYCHDPIFQVPRDTMCKQDDNQSSVNFKAELVSPKHALNDRTASSDATIGDGCLCGCGGDAMRCLRPNRPPSMPIGFFFDKSLDLHMANLIQFRLEVVVRDLEPSRRIWWREEFGGCAPDRKPLDSEIRSMTGDNLGNVLRTSLPLFNDVTTIRSKAQDQPFRKRQRSMSLPTTTTHRRNDNGNLPQDYTCPQSNAPKSAPLYEFSKKPQTSATEFGTSGVHDVRGRPLFRGPIVAPKAKPLKSPTGYVRRRFPPAMYYPPGRTLPINLRQLFLREPRPHPKRQEPTAEEREKRRQSAQQIFEAAGRKMQQLLAMSAKRKSLPLEHRPSTSKCGSGYQAQLDAEVEKKARNTERFEQMSQRLKQNVEAMKARKNSRYGTALYQHDRWATDDLPTPNVYGLAKRSTHQNLDAVKLRRTALTL